MRITYQDTRKKLTNRIESTEMSSFVVTFFGRYFLQLAVDDDLVHKMITKLSQYSACFEGMIDAIIQFELRNFFSADYCTRLS